MNPDPPMSKMRMMHNSALPLLLVTFAVDARGRAVIAEALGDAATVAYLPDLDAAARTRALASAGALVTGNIGRELRPNELPLIARARLVQFMSAGVDYISFADLPAGVPMAANRGAYAAAMAEHVAAMALAAAKRLVVEHRNLARGEFNQFTETRRLAGGVCGIFGFGGIGAAVARLMRCLGMRIHAVNRRGVSEEPVDWIGSPADLPRLLAASDVVVIAVPLTASTERAIGAAELRAMKKDAILVNVARGEIVDEEALWNHLQANPRFTACLDAWWVEPVRHGAFRVDHPFVELPNVIGSPHNSASSAGARDEALRYAVENCRRALTGQPPVNLIAPDERLR
jgi:phosphoglycerate dehydrogenase-like enzyme